jgi:hypothetical protein
MNYYDSSSYCQKDKGKEKEKWGREKEIMENIPTCNLVFRRVRKIAKSEY